MDSAMSDVDMTQVLSLPPSVIASLTYPQYANALDGATTYTPAARGWTKELIEMNHKDYVLKELADHPDDCIAAVILASDFVDRARGATVIKDILMSDGIPDSDKVDILPPIPKEPVSGRPLGMPWTSVITNCSAAFKAAVYANPVFHASHQGIGYTFYCMPAQPQTPWIFVVFTGFTDAADDVEIKSALFAKLISDPDILKMVKEDHTNIPGEHKPELILAIALRFGSITKRTVRRGGRFDTSAITAHCVMIAPISKDHSANLRLQRYIMTAGFVVDAQKRGEGTPWLGGNPFQPQLMNCTECHGVDHYVESCPIMDSLEYRAAHGIPTVPIAGPSVVPTSLLMAQGNAGNDWTSVPYRGGGRGRAYGASRGRGLNGGYAGGGRGNGGGGFYERGNGYKPYH
ncbi:hypothetical protein C8R46DRAFT_1238869 [Mycena filopes]|nr:hypothetical protein C8R46DRAFT_1238869 [Mycena filopes]